MASAYIPAPGTKYGPCVNEACGHRDCESSRRDASKVCVICGDPIGYDRHCYMSGDDTPSHAVCLEEKVERERAESKELNDGKRQG